MHGFGVLFRRVDGCCCMLSDGLWIGMLYPGSSPMGCPCLGFVAALTIRALLGVPALYLAGPLTSSNRVVEA